MIFGNTTLRGYVMKAEIVIDDDDLDVLVRDALVDMRAILISWDDNPDLVKAFTVVSEFYGAKFGS